MNPDPSKLQPDRSHQIVVIVGQPDQTLTDGLRSVGLTPVARDGQVVIWSRQLQPSPTPAPPPTPRLETGPANLLMTIADAAIALGLGRSTVYELIGQGQLEVVHVGRSARVPTDAVRALVEKLRGNQVLDHRRRATG